MSYVATLIMFRDLNTLELTFCVELIIMLLLEPPSLYVLLPHLSTYYLPNHDYCDDYHDDYHYNDDYHDYLDYCDD